MTDIEIIKGKATTIGQKIKNLRQEKRLPQYRLAEKLGVNKMSINNWERGLFEPNIFNCIALADFFGVSLDELCCREI